MMIKRLKPFLAKLSVLVLVFCLAFSLATVAFATESEDLAEEATEAFAADASAEAGDASSEASGEFSASFEMPTIGGGEISEVLDVEVNEEQNSSVDTFMTYLLILVIVVGVIALAVVAVVLFRILKKRAAGKGYKITMSAIAIVLVAVIVAANVLTSTFANSVNAVFTKSAASDTSVTSTADQWKNLVYEIADEGMVLMENKDGTLPLAAGTKVNLLGYYSFNPYYSGSGSGSVSAADSIGIVKSLEDAGFAVNPALQTLYPVQVTENAGMGFSSAALSLDEISIDKYTGENSFENLKDYSDVAIVTIGRTGGEGYDLTGYEKSDYLALDENEKALLKAARDNFATLIVLINTGNALEMDFVDEYSPDAVIWTGEPGPYGFASLGRILNGAVNPSGHLPDTWVYDNDSAPAMENFGEQAASNAPNRYYVDYVEGIYVGYKWYETAYAEGAVITNTKTGKTYDYNDYESIVKYPFGYGLSYTTFDKEITGGTLRGAAMDPHGDYTVEVKVTNTGSVAGKEVVQLYMTAPYTDYDKQNGVEKAAVQLIAYGKTSELAPNASETLTLTVKAEELASYDVSHDNDDGTKGSYMLDAGTYEFSVRTDAHTPVESFTTTVEEQYFYAGENGRDSDDQVAHNQFSDAARGEYLSRNNAFANYASAMASVKDTIESDAYATTVDLYDPSYDTAVTKHYVEGVDYAAPGKLTLRDMVGLDYDDPMWDEIIKQITADELYDMITDTMYANTAVPSINKGRTSASDGPLGISSMFNADINSIAYPCIPVLAATFNDDLAYRFGSYMADQAHNLGVTSWYAPAMDTHRTAYSGRNFEYYSEDAVLSANTAAAEVKGARDKGLIVFIKHFALNDQETHRAYIHTYAGEQAIREIYLKPFESAVKNGGATAVMTSMNYIGDIYAGGHEPLITEVLRNEWGFRGATLTDMDEGGEMRSVNACLRAGMDTWLGMFGKGPQGRTDADIYYMQRAAHNILYMEANANMVEAEIANWHQYVIILSVELGVIAAALCAAVLLTKKKEVIR